MADLEGNTSTFSDDMINIANPETDEISEKIMAKVYAELHGNIDLWTIQLWQENIYAIGDDWRQQATEHLLPTLGLDTDIIDRLGAPYVARRVIWTLAMQNELNKHIFEKPYPLGVTEEEEALFDDESESTSARQGNTWRSEKVRKLISSSKFRDNQWREYEEVMEAAAQSFTHYFPDCVTFPKDREWFRELFRERIFYAAMKLHQAMRCSSNRYYLHRRDIEPEKKLRFYEDCFMLDIRTFQPICQWEEDGVAVMCLVPELIRLPDLSLANAGFLVKVYEPSDPSVSPKEGADD